MRLLISDYSGHPFQVQLSRGLASRGHQVRHVFSASFQTPKGRLVKDSADPDHFEIVPVQSREPFAKQTFVKRRFQEIELGQKIAAQVTEFRPDIVISSNAPLDTQRQILKGTRDSGSKFIFWVQDIYSHAIRQVLSKRIPVIGGMIGKYYERMEAAMIRASDHAVLISSDFVEPITRLAGPGLPMTVIENWAPLDEIQRFERDNDWSRANMKPSDFRLVYSGTIGFKHNPDFLLALAEGIAGDVYVFSEGEAATFLREEGKKRQLSNFHVSGWLPFSDLPKALSAADALIVILEPEAGIYSVPSKALTYMCIGRPILGAIPDANLAARLIAQHGMGVTVPPDHAVPLVAQAQLLQADPALRDAMGDAALAYAHETFDIDKIVDRFEAIFATLN